MSIIEAHTHTRLGRTTFEKRREREEWKSKAGSRELFVTQVDYLRYKTTLADNVLPEQGVDPTARRRRRRRRMRTLLICCCCATNARRMRPKWLLSNQLFSNKDASLRELELLFLPFVCLGARWVNLEANVKGLGAHMQFCGEHESVTWFMKSPVENQWSLNQ